MTVAELGDRMSSVEFTEWMAFYSIEPFGDERADLRQAMTTSGVANLLQAQAKTPKYTKPEDFMVFRDKPEAQATTGASQKEPVAPETLLAKFNAVTSRNKG